DRLSFLPPYVLAPPFDLEAWYRQFHYSHEQIRTLWWSQMLIWVVETAILLAYILALLTRIRAQSVARGFLETFFPLLLAGLPFVIVMTGYTYDRWFPESSRTHLAGLYGIGAVLVLAGAVNVIGLLTLRRAFTVMAEARVR